MMKYQAYPSYKDSGVEWLGEIPEHWKHKKLSLLADRTTDFVASGSFQSLRENVKYLDEPSFAMLVRTTDLSNRRNVEQVYIDKKSYDFLSNSNLFGGEIILPNIGSVGDVYIYTPLYAHATLAPNAIMLEMNGSNRYYYYVFQDKKVNSALSLIGNEAVQVKFNKTQLRNLVLHAPPLQEQQTIANYLDRETTHIDSLIKEKENFISLLKEKRQALISHAVTKGLDSRVTMKDSGVEWLGEVPEHWDVSKLRYVFSFGKGLTITKANLQDKGIPCVNYGEIHSKYGFEVDASKHDLKYVDESYLISDRSSFLSMGDFIFADTSEDIEGAGNFTHVSSQTKLFAGYHTIIARQVGEQSFRFLAYLIDSETFRIQIRLAVKGVKVFSITQAILRASLVWLPKVGEQQTIANYLDRETNRIDSLIKETKNSIELLKEHRTALISAAVTGKIDVRNKEVA